MADYIPQEILDASEAPPDYNLPPPNMGGGSPAPAYTPSHLRGSDTRFAPSVPNIRDRIYSEKKAGTYSTMEDYMSDVYRHAKDVLRAHGVDPSSPQGQQALTEAASKYRTQAADFVHKPNWQKVGNKLVDTNSPKFRKSGIISPDPEENHEAALQAGALESAHVSAQRAAEDEAALNHAKLYADHTVGPITEESTPQQRTAYKEIYDKAYAAASPEGKAINSQKNEEAKLALAEKAQQATEEAKKAQADVAKRHQDLRESIAAAREPWSDEAKHKAHRYDASLAEVRHERMALHAEAAKLQLPENDPDYKAKLAAFDLEESRIEDKLSALETSQRKGAKEVLPKTREGEPPAKQAPEDIRAQYRAGKLTREEAVQQLQALGMK